MGRFAVSLAAMSLEPTVPTELPSRWLLTILLAQMSFGLLAMTISLPSMQEWGVLLDGSAAAVQLTFSAYLVTFGVFQLFYGPLSDRIGRKRALLLGLGVAIMGSVWAALATSLPMLTAARALQGAGCAAGMVVGRAMVQDLYHGPERTRVMAYVGMVMGLCPPLATVIGGQLHVHLGWQANFVLMALVAVVLWLAAWRGLPSHVKSTQVQAHWFRAMVSSYGQLAREPEFLLYVVVLSMMSATFYAFLAGAPGVLGTFGVGPDGVGFYIMLVPLSYIAGNFLTSRLAHRKNDRNMMFWGQVLALGGIALMGLLAWGGAPSPLAFAVPLMLLGLGNGLLVPPALAGTIGLLPALAGSAAAVAGLTQQLMGALGGFGVGLLPQVDARPLAVLMLSLAGVGALAQWKLFQREAKTPPGPVRH
jgi:DHA1 family bicyclomycin/chloramphenicol resistance-like MFS transporter